MSVYTEQPSTPTPTKPVFEIPSHISDIAVQLILWFLLLVVLYIKEFMVPHLKQTILWLRTKPHQYDLEVERLLAEIVGSAQHSCRAVFYEFHNGERTATGRHFRRISASQEYCRVGYASFAREVQSSPISTVSHILEALNTQPVVVERDLDNKPGHYQLLYTYGVRSCVQFLVSTTNHPYAGMVEIHYPKSDINPPEIEEIDPAIDRIRLLIEKSSRVSATEVFHAMLVLIKIKR